MAAYAFSEGSGTTVGDASGGGLTGTISGATWTQGKYGNALSFNGTSGYVNLGNPTQLKVTGSMTWSAWVKAAANPADDGIIIGKADPTFFGWTLKTSPDNGSENFCMSISTPTNTYVGRYSTTVRSLNTWYYVAGVYNAAAKTLDIYVNGVLDDGILTGTVPSSQNDPADNVNIGRRGGGFYFNGVIDEVRMYSRALTQAEIQSDMNTPIGSVITPPSSPVLTAPANGATGVAVNPTLTWNVSAGATSYRVQVSTSSTFATTIADTSGLVATSYTPNGLTNGTVYYWHVNATNSGGSAATTSPRGDTGASSAESSSRPA